MDNYIASLTPEALRDLARNHAARPEYRRAAAERLVKLEHRHAAHPEVAAVLARGGYGEPSLEDFVPAEDVAPEPSPESGQELGPFKASFTTADLMQDGQMVDLDEDEPALESDGKN